MNSRVIRPCGLVIRDHTVLVMRYQYGPHERFNLPGGNLEAEESLHECLIREFREELDLEVVPGELLHAAETRTDKSTLHLVFRAEADGEPRLNPLASRAAEILWLPEHALVDAPLYPALGGALARWFAGQPDPAYLGRIEQPWYR
ncbi:MAG: NUDIX hydrolase [Magnetococcales bacterium]|nr:NUDIX hydrolase [Magnetococcales bacterium]